MQRSPVGRGLRDRPRPAVVLLLAAILAAVTGCDDPQPIRIGFVGGLSGRSADIGEVSRNAVQIAVQDVNSAGGIDGRPIELLVRDDEGEPQVAADAVRALHDAGVTAIIGPNTSVVAAGMLPAIDELEVVTISPTASSLAFVDLDDFLLRISWTTQDNARIYARHYADLRLTRIAAAIDMNNRVFSESWLQEFSSAFADLGGKVVATDLFDAHAARGYSDTARRLLDSDPEAILLIANSVDTAQLAQQVRKLDGEVLLIAAEWAASERLLYLGGKAIDGLELVQSYNRNDTSPGYLRFRDSYRAQFQQEPGYSGVAAHDAATVLFRALQGNASLQGPALKAALLDLPPVAGLQQPVKFNRFGDAQRRAFFVQVRDGRFVAE